MAGTIRGPGHRARAKLISSSFTGQNDITTRCYLKTAVPVIKTRRMAEQMVTCGKNGSHMRWEVSRLGVVTGRLPGEALVESSLRASPRGRTVNPANCIWGVERVWPEIRSQVVRIAQVLLDCRPHGEFRIYFRDIFEDTENVLSRGSPRSD